MIVETFNLDEIQKEVLKDYYSVARKLLFSGKKYAKDFRNKRCRITYSAPEKIIINGNTYIAFFGSPTSSLKDFGFQLFLKVLTSKGVSYYRILGGGLVFKISNHFIKRFIERSQYNCNSNNFLLYLAKDLNVPMVAMSNGDVSYSSSLNGFVVMQNNCYITYMTDLSRINNERKEAADKDVSELYSRNDSIEDTKEFYKTAFMRCQ